jgi:hypothetical protein
VGVTALPIIMIQDIESKTLFETLSIESAAGEKKKKKKEKKKKEENNNNNNNK